jgi:5-carboxymethyl-2-hydroxymuconic-semialdehyde dehydrogenase
MDTHSTVAGVTVDTRHWIGGQRVGSTATFTDSSPIDGRPLAEIARGGEAEAGAAVAAATAAFSGWAATTPGERARILTAIADGVDKRVEDLAIVETHDKVTFFVHSSSFSLSSGT